MKQWVIRRRSTFAVLALLILTEGVYLRPDLLLGAGTLVGLDYDQLHIRRITFAREALLGARHTIPAWYPHEFLGSPFAANLQSFPWIPTRLLLLVLDPEIAYAAAVAMAAALSAIFTWLYCRRAGLTRIGAVAAGFTFAGAGYFASRVMAGHLPLLEAYPALPLMLWAVDRAIAPERCRQRRLDLGVLALCCTCVVVAGHPQLPAYSVASALVYAAWRSCGWLRARVAAAIVLGIGLAMTLWWPMLLLIRRSTRVLQLAAAENDIAMPYRRLLALVVPAVHGWASPVNAADKNLFAGFPNNAYFWDTASYVGILPLVAIIALTAGCVVRRRLPDGKRRFLTFLGAGAFLCSLPLASPVLHLIPGTLLRSPARLLYLWTFCMAVALGAAVDAFRRIRWSGRALGPGLLAAGLALHFADLWGHANRFIQVTPRFEEPQKFQTTLDRTLDNARIAREWSDPLLSSRDRYDDAGGFDSILLAPFYRGLLALAGDPPYLNRQLVDASELPAKALEAAGVRFVITTNDRKDLELVETTEDTRLYRVPNPAPRAAFFAQARTEFVAEQNLPEAFAKQPHNRLLLPIKYASYPAPRVAEESTSDQYAIHYSRPSSDEFVLQVASDRPGFVRLLEAYDPGWAASVDGTNAPLLTANGFAMAIPVAAGQHAIRLRYQTPGRAVGEGLSLLSLLLLIALIAPA